MRNNLLSFAPVVRTVRTLEHFHHYHLDDGSRCRTPHDLCHRKHSSILVDRDVSENLVTTAGLNELLDGVFNEAPAGFSWYCGLVANGSFSAYAAGDTLASHAGWTESTEYTGNRPAWTKNGAAAAGAMSNSSSKASFSVNDTDTIRGAFMASVNTGTSGILYGAGDFSGTRSVVSGDTLTLQVDLSAASA